MAETKVVYHGTTVVDASESSNPPGYSSGPPPGAYPPPPGAYPPPPGAYPPHSQGVTVVQQPTMVAPVIMVSQMGPNPARVTCKSCNCEIVTRVEVKASTRTHLFAALLCVLGCWCCCCIPYCVDSCMSTNHYCPNCNAYIGNYKS